MNIAGLVRSSTVDFPGQIAAVIFTAGCNLDCFYCHNRLLLADAAPHLEETGVLAFLEKRRGLIDGVVFSGGEPTLQQDLPEWIGKVRNLGYQIKLDTNGSHPDILQRLLATGQLDYVAIDCKAPWLRYPEFCDCTQSTVHQIQQSFQILQDSEISWEIRTTVIPQLSPADLTQMTRTLPQAPLYALQRYNRPTLHRPEDRFRLEAEGYTPAQLVLLAGQLRQYQPNIIVR